MQKLQEGKIESLRQMIYDAGREYPRPELVTNVLRPLRSQISANVAAAMTLREILDGILIAYTSFCLEGDKKRRAITSSSAAGTSTTRVKSGSKR